MNRKKLIISVMFLFIMVVGVLISYGSTNFSALNSKNSIELKSEDFSPDFSAKNHKDEGNKHLSYEISIPKSKFESLVEGDYHLIIYRLADNAHKIYFNDIAIGSRGDLETGNSNLWNGLSTYLISKDSIKEENVLKIETFSIYRSGLSKVSVYILDDIISNKLLHRLYILGEYFILLSLGFIVFSSAISVILYLILKRNNKIYLFLGLGAFFTGIYFSDYLPYENTVLPYLLYKKITMASLFIALSFYSFAISIYFDKIYLKYLGIVTTLGTVIIILLSPDLIVFKTIYTYWYLIALVNVLVWIVLSAMYAKEKMEGYIFLIGFTVIGIYGSFAVFADMFGSEFSINSPILYITVLATLVLLLVYEDINNQELLIGYERSLKEIEFINSITDGLTGLKNQRYLSSLLKENFENSTLAIMDIDDFKIVNDTYGHMAGDVVLIKIAEIIKNSIRKTDIVCRYGGDEFVILLDNCEMSEAYQILENIRKTVEEVVFTYEESCINTTISVGLYKDHEENNLEKIFKLVDGQLYRAKSNGKNIVVYENALV